MIVHLHPWWNALLELLYPSHCFSCGHALEPGGTLCDSCRNEVCRIVMPCCLTCSRPFPGSAGVMPRCPNCDDQTFAFESAVAVVQAKGVARELIHRFKYRRQFHIRRVLGEWLAAGFSDPRLEAEPVDALVPVPLHPLRLRERGYNQAAALAATLSKKVGVPVADCLLRTRYTPSQTQFDRVQRRRNLREAFAVRKRTVVSEKRLLLIDDVLTTGSTLHECAAVLLDRGARSVRALTVARG
ncbi:MAG: ComF family protein [Verrucomicrobia bacterium]|nr:ComF family protein [Verrucomicrobiota bacterium]